MPDSGEGVVKGNINITTPTGAKVTKTEALEAGSPQRRTTDGSQRRASLNLPTTQIDTGKLMSNLVQPPTSPVIKRARKMHDFFNEVRRMASRSEKSTHTEQQVNDLIQSLLEEELTEELFAVQLETTLDSVPRPNLVGLLKKYLPSYRTQRRITARPESETTHGQASKVHPDPLPQKDRVKQQPVSTIPMDHGETSISPISAVVHTATVTTSKSKLKQPGEALKKDEDQVPTVLGTSQTSQQTLLGTLNLKTSPNVTTTTKSGLLKSGVFGGSQIAIAPGIVPDSVSIAGSGQNIALKVSPQIKSNVAGKNQVSISGNPQRMVTKQGPRNATPLKQEGSGHVPLTIAPNMARSSGNVDSVHQMAIPRASIKTVHQKNGSPKASSFLDEMFKKEVDEKDIDEMVESLESHLVSSAITGTSQTVIKANHAPIKVTRSNTPPKQNSPNSTPNAGVIRQGISSIPVQSSSTATTTIPRTSFAQVIANSSINTGQHLLPATGSFRLSTHNSPTIISTAAKVVLSTAAAVAKTSIAPLGPQTQAVASSTPRGTTVGSATLFQPVAQIIASRPTVNQIKPGSNPQPTSSLQSSVEAQAKAMEAIEDQALKLRSFFNNLVRRASDEIPQIGQKVKDLVQNVMEGKLSEEEFAVKLQTTLNSPPQPNLVGFLKKTLPLLRSQSRTPTPIQALQKIKVQPAMPLQKVVEQPISTTRTSSPQISSAQAMHAQQPQPQNSHMQKIQIHQQPRQKILLQKVTKPTQMQAEASSSEFGKATSSANHKNPIDQSNKAKATVKVTKPMQTQAEASSTVIGATDTTVWPQPVPKNPTSQPTFNQTMPLSKTSLLDIGSFSGKGKRKSSFLESNSRSGGDDNNADKDDGDGDGDDDYDDDDDDDDDDNNALETDEKERGRENWVVPFSLFDVEQVPKETAEKFKNEDPRVYWWDTPDFLNDSLFADFLEFLHRECKENHTNKLVYECIHEPQQLQKVILSLNKQRTGKYKERDISVYEQLLKDAKEDNEISVEFEDDKIICLYLLITDKNDPDNTIRKEMIRKSSLKEQLQSQSDEEEEYSREEDNLQESCLDITGTEDYPPDEDKLEECVPTRPGKPCYYPSQIEMGFILKRRVDAIMKHYHGIQRLHEAFDEVEFLIYTARYRMLRKQTEERLRHPDAGVLPNPDEASATQRDGRQRMFMYVLSTETTTNHEKLKTRIQHNPRTLFVVVADECHWGITKGTENKPSAHNLFINEFCEDPCPKNVFVVQISATPFNLLTQNSRLPIKACTVLNEDVEGLKKGDILVQEEQHKGKGSPIRQSPALELHVVHWTEVEMKNFEKGVQMRLKCARLANKSSVGYITVRQDKLEVCSDRHEACSFIAQGEHGVVTLEVIGGECDEKNGIFVGVKDGNLVAGKVTENMSEHFQFQVKLEFGVGVVAFSSMLLKRAYICVDKDKKVQLFAASERQEHGITVLRSNVGDPSTLFEFFMEDCAPVMDDCAPVTEDCASFMNDCRPRKAVKPGPQYLSLNYYLSTIDNDSCEERKIREDIIFQELVDDAKRQKKILKQGEEFTESSLLCADYVYHLLHLSVFNSQEKKKSLLYHNSASEMKVFEEKIQSFQAKLRRQRDEDKSKGIPPEAFSFLCDSLIKRTKKDFKDLCRTRKHRVEKEQLLNCYVSCLMYLPSNDLDTLKKEHPDISTIENDLRLNECEEFHKIWDAISGESETRRMMQDLIANPSQNKGAMKIVRVKKTKSANAFLHTLRIGRDMSLHRSSFEVIGDYGDEKIDDQLMKSSSLFFKKFQSNKCCESGCVCNEFIFVQRQRKCGKCNHVHKRITQYEDLEDLACVLILVEKGRMGDTFPHSFNCMDLRLSFDSSKEFGNESALYISSLIQELGRMCRYATVSPNDHASIPYALVGRQLFKDLRNSLERSPAISAIKKRPDRYMNSKNADKLSSVHKQTRPNHVRRWLRYEASKESYDYHNVDRHSNRILLQAEPQIGKTGSYLYLIKLLRDDIVKIAPKENYVFTAEHAEHELQNEDHSKEDNGCLFPYWKDMREAGSLLTKPVRPGKYTVGGKFYTHDVETNPLQLTGKRKRVRCFEVKEMSQSEVSAQVPGPDLLRAWQWSHFMSCSSCGRLLESSRPAEGRLALPIEEEEVSVVYSIPYKPPFCSVQDVLSKGTSSTTWKWGHLDTTSQSSETRARNYWIFHPSHRDPKKCTLNYQHVMDDKGKKIQHIQAVVVQKGNYEEYQHYWGKTHMIIQLPDKLPGCDETAQSGGIGFARLFIQRLANHLKLEYVFVFDDNVAMMSEAETELEDSIKDCVNRNEDGMMIMKRCSFARPMLHMQSLVQGQDKDKGTIPSKHSYTSRNEDQIKLLEMFRSFPKYRYTGPATINEKLSQPEGYAILGITRSFPNALKSYSKAQVYSAVLLNVKATVENGIFYRPWPCWEDLRFNDDCDKAGLWVVKFNRYHHLKLHYKDWINDLHFPEMFLWDNNTKLLHHPEKSLPTLEQELEMISTYLETNVAKSKRNTGKAVLGSEVDSNEEDTNLLKEVSHRLDVPAFSLVSKEKQAQMTTAACIVHYTKKTSLNTFMRYHTLLVDKRFKRLVFLQSAKDSKPFLSTSEIKSQLHFCTDMAARNPSLSVFTAGDPEMYNLRCIVIDITFSDDNADDENGTQQNELTDHPELIPAASSKEDGGTISGSKTLNQTKEMTGGAKRKQHDGECPEGGRKKQMKEKPKESNGLTLAKKRKTDGSENPAALKQRKQQKADTGRSSSNHQSTA